MPFLVNVRTKEQITINKDVHSIGTFIDSDTKISALDETQIIIRKELGKTVVYKGCGRLIVNRKAIIKKILEDGDEINAGGETFIYSTKLKSQAHDSRHQRVDKNEANLMPTANEINIPDLMMINDRFAQIFNSITEITDLIDTIGKTAIEFTRAEKGFFVLYDKNVEEQSVKSMFNIEQNVKDYDKFNSVYVDNLLNNLKDNNSNFINNIALKDFPFIKSLLLAKFKIRNNVIGYLCLINKINPNEPYTNKDKYIAEILSTSASAALDKVQLYEKTKQETDVIRRLQRYLPRKTISKLMGNKANLTMIGDIQVCTILFADIYDFGGIAEKVTPVDLVALLNEYFTVMTRIIFSFNGSISKFINDSLVAVFGAPLMTQNHALESVLAALEMQRHVSSLEQKFMKKYNLESFQIRVGINTGDVIYGNVGAPQRMDFTVLGYNVELPSQIVSNAPSGTILLSHSTFDKVRTMVKARPVSDEVMGEIAGITNFYEVYDKIEDEIFFKSDDAMKADYNIREHMRVPVKAVTFVYKHGVRNQGLIKDISIGGLCVKAAGNYRADDEIELTFKLTEELIFKNVRAVIKHISKTKKSEAKNDTNVLMGVKFLNLSDEDYIHLVDYIDKKCFKIV